MLRVMDPLHATIEEFAAEGDGICTWSPGDSEWWRLDRFEFDLR